MVYKANALQKDNVSKSEKPPGMVKASQDKRVQRPGEDSLRTSGRQGLSPLESGAESRKEGGPARACKCSGAAGQRCEKEAAGIIKCSLAFNPDTQNC